jgi:hypothetical protein
MLRPTLQGRKGYNPGGFGPGVSAPFGYSSAYSGKHNGEDYFWLTAGSASALQMTVADSMKVFAVVPGTVHHVTNNGLGNGLWQQINSDHRAYYWHLAARSVEDGRAVSTSEQVGVMGHTGTAAGTQTHLHFEVRKYPYNDANRIDPEPFFNSSSPSGGGTTPIEEIEMAYPVGIKKANGSLAVLNEIAAPEFPDGTNYQAWERVYDFGWKTVSDADFDWAVTQNYIRSSAATGAHPLIQHPNGAIAEVGEFSFTTLNGQAQYEGASYVHTGGPRGFRRVTAQQYAEEQARVAARRSALVSEIGQQNSGGFTSSDRALLEDLPSNGQMGQALTSTVSLVNEHADANKQDILDAIDEIPSTSSGSSAYGLSLTIDEIPGTATGTATPQ